VNQQKVVYVSGNDWETLPIQGYYLMDMDVDLNGNVYVVDDTGLSSTIMPNRIYRYSDGTCTYIIPEESCPDIYPHRLKSDLRNYLWLAKFSFGNEKNLMVYDGKTWHKAPGDFLDLQINCISVDKNNNIWLGTSEIILPGGTA